jgi:hypothetical protein
MRLRDAVLAHLWVDAPMPPDYLELYLARDVYHTWPLPPMSVVGRHLVCLSAESQVKQRGSKT